MSNAQRVKIAKQRTAGRVMRIGLFLSLFIAHHSVLPVPAAAQTTADDIFKSMRNDTTPPADATKALAVAAAVVGGVVLVLLVAGRRKAGGGRPGKGSGVNHPGKLMKEVTRSVNLKPAEIRQLKALAERQEIDSPLTLLLCPSLLAKSMKDRPAKVDAKVVAQVARKLASPR